MTELHGPSDDADDRIPPDGDATRLLQALASALHSGGSSLGFPPTPKPEVRPAPATTRGLRLRIDLEDTHPPVWRRIELAGDMTLDRFHRVIQAAMGWTDTHLHKFAQGDPYRGAEFTVDGDPDADPDGVPETAVRLDQVLAEPGDRLTYEYDFGDGWTHRIRLEEALDVAPERPRCVGGKRACPPEDSGGVGGYADIAEWVRGGRDPERAPEPLTAAEWATWLPAGWDPDAFDVAEAEAAIEGTVGDPVAVPEELAGILTMLDAQQVPVLRELLSRSVWNKRAHIDAETAARVAEPFRILIELVEDAPKLTAAGRLRPELVRELAVRTGIAERWIGALNREDQTYPVFLLRSVAQTLGLVRVRQGRIAPTSAARRALDDPVALLERIADRLPVGRREFDRHAGWVALVVAGSGIHAEAWDDRISAILGAIGWQSQQGNVITAPAPASPTLDALEILAGSLRTASVQGPKPEVAAVARLALQHAVAAET